MKARLLAAPSLALLLACASAGVLACDCSLRPLAFPLDPRLRVFVGEALPAEGGHVVAFRAVEWLAGRPARRVRVATDRSDCDYFPTVSAAPPGARYLVFMRRFDDKNVVNQCSHTAPLEQGSADLRALRAARQRQRAVRSS